MRLQQGRDLRLAVRRDVGQHKVLVRRNDEAADPEFRDRVQSRKIAHAAILDEQGIVPGAIVALNPAEPIGIVGEGELARRLERVPQPALEFGAECVETHALDRVFQPCMLAVGAVAEIALHRHDLLRDVHRLTG